MPGCRRLPGRVSSTDRLNTIPSHGSNRARTPPTEATHGRNPIGRCRLILEINGRRYGVRPLQGELGPPGVVLAWRLARVGAAARYVVAETLEGPTCSCQDMRFRRHGRDRIGCKHIRALKALGLLC